MPRLDLVTAMTAGCSSSSIAPSSMNCSIAGQREFQQESAKTAARLDGREQAPAGHVQALEHSLQQERHLVDEPVGLSVLEQEAVVIEHRIHVTGGPDHPGPQGQLVGPQMKDHVIELARNREWPECASPAAAPSA